MITHVIHGVADKWAKLSQLQRKPDKPDYLPLTLRNSF
jgi:hypothetical protein